MHVKEVMGLGLFAAVMVGASVVGVSTLAAINDDMAQHLLIARPWDSTNVYVLDRGLTSDDCAYDLATFTDSPMVELEPGKWIERDGVQLSCTLDGDF